MSLSDILLLAAVACCVYLAIRTLRRSGGTCGCGGSCGRNCKNCNKCDKGST